MKCLSSQVVEIFWENHAENIYFRGDMAWHIHCHKTNIFGMRLDKEKLGVINHICLSMHIIRCSFDKKVWSRPLSLLSSLLQRLYGARPVPKSDLTLCKSKVDGWIASTISSWNQHEHQDVFDTQEKKYKLYSSLGIALTPKKLGTKMFISGSP
jgi:hypothetical protein